MQRAFLKSLFLFSLVAGLGFTSSCSKDGDNILLFSVEDDKALGDKVAAQTDSMFRADPAKNGRLLERASNPQAYAALQVVVDRVLNSGKLAHRDDFTWDVKIVQKDDIQNAFATPGGHIYVYTGLIKYLDHEAELAGVLGHEIAHADRRHTSQLLQKQYGIDILLSLLLGDNPSQLAQIATGLGSLQFSRDYERDADDYSVVYLNGTQYSCDGAAGFFIKSQQEGAGGTPEFLSTHPNPENRVAAIQNKAKELNCQGKATNDANLNALKSVL
ncbi:peptidase M48 [Hymenobacter aquaticus]|uniref:Peptidase M48 n=1 Tax=Hymenobacter aquaticus TaxID=1867101 RepID=A0A4Z0Q5P0_9BACT|nr:M48 family metalloprotease [Hymenobacter aquaticus]TGE24463.1 peptidase M48 [Hymenobacter aquaticus]